MSQSAPAMSPAPVRPRNGLAVAALVLGIVAALGCLVPVLNIGSIVLAVVGLVLGLVSLVKRRAGKGMAIAGIVLSVVAIVTAIIVNVAAAAVVSGVDQAVTDTENGYSAADADDQSAAAAALAPGTPATIGDYTVAVTSVQTNANQVIAEANPLNAPPTGQYVLVDLTVTNNGQEEAAPWVDVTTEFQGADARNYSTTSCTAVVPNMGIMQPNLRPTGTSSYQVCFDVPVEAIGGGVVAVEQFGNLSDDQVVWNLQ